MTNDMKADNPERNSTAVDSLFCVSTDCPWPAEAITVKHSCREFVLPGDEGTGSWLPEEAYPLCGSHLLDHASEAFHISYVRVDGTRVELDGEQDGNCLQLSALDKVAEYVILGGMRYVVHYLSDDFHSMITLHWNTIISEDHKVNVDRLAMICSDHEQLYGCSGWPEWHQQRTDPERLERMLSSRSFFELAFIDLPVRITRYRK